MTCLAIKLIVEEIDAKYLLFRRLYKNTFVPYPGGEKVSREQMTDKTCV
jgi:hypothetical protein